MGLKPSTVEQAKFEYSPLGKVFNKRLDKDDQKEGLFKRLKNFGNAQKNLISSNDDDNDDDDDDDDNSIYYTPKLQFDEKDEMDPKPLNVFDYLNCLSQKAKDLVDEIEDANNDIDKYKLAYIGSNQEKFNFNIFKDAIKFSFSHL